MAQPGPSSSKAPSNAKILYSGVLMKKGEYHRSWKERWFVLFDNRQLLYYHGREEFQDSKPCISAIDLKQVTAIQPVASINTPTGKKSSKKGGGFWSSSKDKSGGRDQGIIRSQSMHTPSNGSHNGFPSRASTARGYHTEDSIEHSATMTSMTSDSPIPSLPQQNSLRMSFKSLMGKKSTGKKPDLSEKYSNNSRYNGSRLGTNGYNDDYEDSFGDGSDMNELPARDSSGNLNIRFKAEFPFEIVTPSRTYLLCCLDAYSFNDWLEHLRNVTFGKKIYGGWLTKQGSKNKSWKKRWFVIFDTREIRYYETEKGQQEKGSIILDDLQIMNLLEDKAAKSMYKKKNVFELVCGGRKWVLVANSKEERELWFNRVVQVVPSVQRLDPLYSNELSYKRNDRAKKWMKGYFAMDPEYLFFFKNKHSFDMFKSSAYFQEDLYTLALAQHVQGLIPLRNRKIKELDRNHPACSGKNKFVFSLKTSAGEFFLSTQYSIQMDDWLDAFRELYRLEIQEKRQGVISKRRKHSNSFGRRPPSPPSRAGSQYSNGRSISPAPSETSHHFGAATMEDDEKNGGRRRNRGGVAEAGKFGGKTRGRKNSPPARGSGKGGYYSMPNMNGVQGFATASSIRNPNKNKNKEPPLERWESPDEYTANDAPKKNGHRKRKPPHRGGSRKGKSRNNGNNNPRIFSDDDDSPPPPDEAPDSPEIAPMPDTKPPDRNVHRRTNTPFKDIDLKMAQRRKSKEKIWGDANESHYDINTKNVSGRKSDGGKNLVNTTPLAEGYEDRSSGDSDGNSKDSEDDDVIDEWQGKKGKKKGSKRPKRKDKKRKQSVGTVLKNKISNMRSGKKAKEDKKEAKKRKKSKERKEKEKKKEAKRRKEEEAKRKKEEKEKEARRKKQEKAAKKMDVMKSLDQTKKDLKKGDGRKSKKDKTRRRSLGDVLKRKKKEQDDTASKQNGTKKSTDDQKENGKTTTLKVTGTSSSNGRKKRSEKFRRRSTGEALKEQAKKQEEEEEPAKMTKSNTLRAPGQESSTNGSKSGRKSRKDKTRRKSVNDVIKGAFGSKKKTDDDQEEKEEKDTKPKSKNGRKSKKDKNRRVSLGNPFKWGSKKNKDGEKSEDEDDEKPTKKPSIKKAMAKSNEVPSSSKRDQVRRRRDDRGPKKPTQIQTNTSASSEDSQSGDSKSKSKSTPKRKSRKNRDKSDELNRYKQKITAKTRDKRRAAHRRKETPSYDINTKEILMQEYEKANFSGDESDDPNAVASAALSEDAETDPMYGDDASTPKAPPKGYRSYRKQQVEITKKGKGKGTAKDTNTKTRGFRRRGKETGDDEDDRRDSGNTKGKGFKIQKINHPKKVQPAKTKDKVRKPVQYDDDESGDELTSEESESEYETGSESEYETGSTDETGSTETDTSSGSTDSDTESDSEYETGSSDEETDSGDTDESSSDDTEDSETRKALKAIMKAKKSMDEDGDEMADYDWDAALKRKKEKKTGRNLEDKRQKKEKEMDKRHKEKMARQEKKRKQEEARKKQEEEEKRKKAAEEAKKEEERKKREREKQREEAARKKKQIEEERKKREKLELEEQERREKRQKLHEAEDEEEYEDEEEEYASDESEDEESGDTSSEDDEPSEEDDSLSDNSDQEQEELDAAMAAYVQLNSNDTSAIPEGNEHEDWVKQQAAIRLHKRKSTELWKWNTQQMLADENDETVADQKELNKMWMKLKTIPKSSKKDTTETRIVKEFMMFQLNHDHSIRDEYIVIENMNYPNIYEWNGMFVGPMGTPYVNGKYRILIKFPRDYPSKPPKITFLTKIYNSSVKHNKRKKRGLLRLPKFFDKIWSKKISLRQWLNVVYEFLFFYCGDHFFDPMNQRVAREFIFAFDSFIDTCYQWNLIFANGYDRNKNMIELHDEYGERQKLTFHLAKYSNQYDKKQYQFIKEVIWQTIRDKYHATYESFTVLLDYFGNEFYYCGLSELIREPHICVKHKVKRYDNIVKW